MPRKSGANADSHQKHRLTLAQLASYDDVLTDALVDQAYFWARIRKNRENKYLPVRGIKQDEVPQILLHKVIIAKDVEDAEKALLNLAGLRRYLGGLRTEAEKKDFRNHLGKYINMYLPDSPFEVSTTNRYTITAHEAAVTARKRIREGDKIKYLCGTLVPLTDAELMDLDLSQRNFSIVQSDRKKNTLIFLGPARFANHDCAANGRLVSVGKDGLEVHATRNIDIGEEITVTYSPGYFGSNNEECLCHTCELQGRNGWTSKNAFGGAPQSGECTPNPSEGLSESPFSLQKKRKQGSESGSVSSRQSPSPSKKQKLGRPPSRLNLVLTPPRSPQSAEKESTPLTRLGEDALPSGEHQLDGNGVTAEDGIGASTIPTTIGVLTIADPPKRKKMRLIDQMTSSAGSSPEAAQKSGLQSSISGESGHDTLSSRMSSQGTQMTCLSDPPIMIKIEEAETTKLERDDISCLITNPLPNSPKPLLDISDPAASTKPVLDPTHTSLLSTTADPPLSLDVLPSIEPPTVNTDTDRGSTTTTTTSATTFTILPLPDSTTTTIRTPGDYILTRRLVAQPFDRWVQCQTCTTYFLQSNGYQTRRECPRCERHSMLYGFGWPKTEPDARKLREIREAKEKAEKSKAKKGGRKKSGLGPHDIEKDEEDTIVVRSDRAPRQQRKGGGVWGRARKGAGGRSGRSGKGTWVEGGGEDEREERVMDHRTVNRFIAPEEERLVRKRGQSRLFLEHANGALSGSGSGSVSISGSVVAIDGPGSTKDSSATPDHVVLAQATGVGGVGAGSGGTFAPGRDGLGNAAAAGCVNARGSSLCAREEEEEGSMAATMGCFEDANGTGDMLLRRSKRFFGTRIEM